MESENKLPEKVEHLLKCIDDYRKARAEFVVRSVEVEARNNMFVAADEVKGFINPPAVPDVNES